MNDAILVCCLVTPERIHPPIAGALQRTCVDCAAAVWVSPASLATIARECASFEIVCMKCAGRRMAADPEPVMMPPSAEQLAECSRELARREEIRG